MNFLRIRSIRKYLTSAATEIIVLSLVIFYLDLCNVILNNIADSDMHMLQRIQHMCIKIKLVYNCRKIGSSKDALFKLHWLHVKARITCTFKISTYMYICSIGNAPVYLTELLTETPVGRSGLRSTVQESFILYDVPFNKMSSFSDRGFMPVCPKTVELLTN